jgi:aminoglycoside/choline kinase family phosphotransferase
MIKQENKRAYIEYLKEMFRKWSGEEIRSFESLPESGSIRKYYRFRSTTNEAIGAFNPDTRENHAFTYLSRHLKNKGINVPDIYAEEPGKNVYLLEDLGHLSLFDYISEKRDDREAVMNMYKLVIGEMPRLQIEAGKDLDYGKCYPRSEFDLQSMLWDLHYFKFYFLKLAGIRFDEQELENDFNNFAKFLLKAGRDFFLFRDFQSRNIMLHNDKIYFIDYQGGRKGALQYDIASLLFEAKTGLTPETRNELLDYYLELFSGEAHFNQKDFLKYYHGYVLIRMMQAFGAYGFRGYFERKHFFLQSIPPAVNHLKWFLQNIQLSVSIPHLWNCLEQIIHSDFINEYDEAEEVLSVSINSFSYRSGIPMDNTGNGGGFVFDCRALPNPGRYEKYKSFNGKDVPVIKFMKEKPEVSHFIDKVYSIIESSLKNYESRNFSHLMINFGCTGGQHRSVYCAEEISDRIKQNYKIRVRLRHRELEK